MTNDVYKHVIKFKTPEAPLFEAETQTEIKNIFEILTRLIQILDKTEGRLLREFEVNTFNTQFNGNWEQFS